MESVECLVVGAGVIGLAVARALARAGREVIVVEGESGIGAGVSSRNSEVIHAGIYYRTGLDKTRLCVDGKAMLYAFCQEFGVPHKRCGKLLVAVNADEVDKLTALKAQAEANGVTDLIWLSGEEARALEPALVAERALLSPSTGIVDSHAFMLALRGDAEAHGAMFAFETPVLTGRAVERGIIIETGGPAPMRIAAGMVVNAAGLGAQALARSIAGMPRRYDPAVASRQGQLLFLARALSLLAPHLSNADSRRPRRASYARSRRTGQVWPGRRMGGRNRLRRRSWASGGPSTPRSEPIGQTCRRARCSQATPASGRRSRGLAARPRISCCRPKRITASPG